MRPHPIRVDPTERGSVHRHQPPLVGAEDQPVDLPFGDRFERLNLHVLTRIELQQTITAVATDKRGHELVGGRGEQSSRGVELA